MGLRRRPAASSYRPPGIFRHQGWPPADSAGPRRRACSMHL